MSSRVDRFVELIAEPTPDAIPARDELLAPLFDLAAALRQRGVEAEAKYSADQRRLHLAVWPAHRPAFKSLVLTLQNYGGRVLVVGNNSVSFDTADELTRWLEDFVQRSEFQRTLASLQSAALEPVDGRLERENRMATVVEIPASLQAQLSTMRPGETRELDLELRPREPTPDPQRLVRLVSAGLEFGIQRATVTGRGVQLTVRKI